MLDQTATTRADEQQPTPAALDAPARKPRKPRGLREFAKTSAIFLISLIATLFLCDRLVGIHLRRHATADGILRTVIASSVPGERVHAIILGDSVARQLFPPGSEPQPGVRFLTTNQALSVAGQYYLMEDALQACPNASAVYLLYIPGCFANNLPPPLSREYLCGYFHSPRQVAEVFKVKGDFALSAAHVGRMLLPNLMLENSFRNHAAAPPQPEAPTAGNGRFAVMQPDMGAEPLFALLERWRPPSPDLPPSPAGSYGPALPPVSEYFLAKMRADCRRRNVTLHVLPCPLSNVETYKDPQRIYQMLPMRVDPALLVDAVHFQRKYVAEYRQKVIDYYHLPIHAE
jgi:hypothetical protein